MGDDEVLERMLDRLTDLVDRSDNSFQRIENEVKELKDQRFRPYFTTMGAFLVITMSVMSYVYSLETRYNSSMLSLTRDIAAVSQSVAHLSDRLDARTDNITYRWGTHSERHQRIDAKWVDLADRLLAAGVLDTQRPEAEKDE